jgi:glutamate/tyrosine decarboxylase-like PLP-dependent enzyme
MLGFGRAGLHRVAVDDEGRMRADALVAALAATPGPTIVCAQAGNVCSGAFDPLGAIADAVAAHGGWLHVDGAFGLWAAAAPTLRHLVDGVARADSWATDAHKWLNVPYDSGFVLVRDPVAHRVATTIGASYLVEAAATERDGSNWVPELSRRARGFTVYAALKSLGRRGVSALVERCCARAREMAARLRAADGVEILNDVVLNQVLVRFTPAAGGDADALTREVIRRVQADGTCWLGGATWHGAAAMRVSVSNWSTTEGDIERSAAAIVRCAQAARQERIGS